jgi:hypothetical protein
MALILGIDPFTSISHAVFHALINAIGNGVDDAHSGALSWGTWQRDAAEHFHLTLARTCA